MAGWTKSWSIPEDHWLRSDLRYIGAWTELINMAERKDGYIIQRGVMIRSERGSVYTSLSELADRWRLSRKWVRHFIEMLTADGMVEVQQRNSRGYTLKLNNYAKYQDKPDSRGTAEGTAEEQQRVQQRNSRGTEKATSFLIYEEGKEGIEGESRTKRFAPPTIEEICSYISEKGLAISAERFFDYYQANGWRVGKNTMKDWRAACRSWAARDKAEKQPSPKRFQNFEPRPDGSLMDDYIKKLEADYGA